MARLFPSLISGNLTNLEQDIRLLEPYCSGFHLDIMDFHFVPNLTWGPDFVNAIRKITKKQLQIHLMVEYPECYIDRFAINSDDIIFVHIESITAISIASIINTIQARGMKAGVAISPYTPLEAVISLPAHFQAILLMSVNPGFSGQAFLPHSIERLKALHMLALANNLSFAIAIDGGIQQDNIQSVIQHGAQDIALASAVFSTQDPAKAAQMLEQKALLAKTN